MKTADFSNDCSFDASQAIKQAAICMNPVDLCLDLLSLPWAIFDVATQATAQHAGLAAAAVTLEHAASTVPLRLQLVCSSFDCHR